MKNTKFPLGGRITACDHKHGYGSHDHGSDIKIIW